MAWYWYALIGYACGSIPFGLLLTRMAGLGDVRQIGSGNIGATNVLRTGNKPIAALTLLCDALKGFIPVWFAGAYAYPEAAIAAGAGAVLGHVFPIWLNFKGGKGVATTIGILFGFYWVLGVFFLSLWLLLAIVFRISSLAALVGSAATPLIAYFTGRTEFILPALALAIVIWVMHRENIKRLLSGSEPKISLSKKP
jgi:acyl phosphate:glycerol-3-phosphate acyltransferase